MDARPVLQQETRSIKTFLDVGSGKDNDESISLPSAQWAGGGLKLHDDTQEDAIIETEHDVQRVLELLRQRHLQLTEKQTEALKEAELQTFDKIFANWNTQYNYSEDEEERVKDFDENHRLEVIWRMRHKCANWTLALSFHVIIIVNFLYCLWESFGIILEDAKFDFLYLEDAYQCLSVVPSHDSASHFVSIFHATTCVVVLHAKTLQTANLCWAFLLGTSVHACFKVYEMLFNERFKFDDTVRGFVYGRLVQLVIVLCIQLIAMLIVIQRYYDLTARFQKRAHKFVTQTYEGRQLNDRIMYRNESSFAQRKYVLRSCIAYQIYNTVQKIHVSKKRVKKGEKFTEESVIQDIKAAVTALKEVEGIQGMEMMRELKRRNFERMKEEYAMEGPGGDVAEEDLDDVEVEIFADEAEAAAIAAVGGDGTKS